MSAARTKDSAAFCADLVRAHDFERYATTLFVSAEKRRALLGMYAFNVEISRVREQVSQPLPGEIRLQWWTDMLAGSGHGGVEGNPVAAELLRSRRGMALIRVADRDDVAEAAGALGIAAPHSSAADERDPGTIVRALRHDRGAL